MNYYNPYFMNYPTTSSPGLLRSLIGGSSINWSSILSNTQKVIGIANQAIPTIKQISPMMKNAKTMFRVMNEFKKVETPTNVDNEVATNLNEEIKNKEEKIENTPYTGGPQFFI